MDHRRPHVTMHVLYWEAAKDMHEKGCWKGSYCRDGCGPPGIKFGEGPVSIGRPQQASFCRTCDAVVAPFRNRLDNMQTTLRMVGKEGKGFRQEVEDFVCLSPKMAIRYDSS